MNSYQGATKIHRYLMKRWDEVIGDDIIGIIKEDDQGFVDYDVYEDEKDACTEWEGMVTWVELEKEREGVR